MVFSATVSVFTRAQEAEKSNDKEVCHCFIQLISLQGKHSVPDKLDGDGFDSIRRRVSLLMGGAKVAQAEVEFAVST